MHRKNAYSGTNNTKNPIAHEDSVGYNIAKASIILKPTSLFQMSAQRGYNFIFQPSEYLLIWRISLAGQFHWPLSPWSPLFTWTLKVAIGYRDLSAQVVFAHLENFIGRLMRLVKWANLSFQLLLRQFGMTRWVNKIIFL